MLSIQFNDEILYHHKVEAGRDDEAVKWLELQWLILKEVMTNNPDRPDLLFIYFYPEMTSISLSSCLVAKLIAWILRSPEMTSLHGNRKI